MKVYRLDENEHELLGKFAAAGRSASLPELNEGLSPSWQQKCLAALLAAAYLELDGVDARAEPRYRLTPAGHAALTRTPVAVTPGQVCRERVPDTVPAPRGNRFAKPRGNRFDRKAG